LSVGLSADNATLAGLATLDVGAQTRLADPPENWPAASPRDAAAVNPREPKFGLLV